MLQLSTLVIANQEFTSFEQLEEAVRRFAKESPEIHFQIDIKPQYPDTPENWEDRLEAAFTS